MRACVRACVRVCVRACVINLLCTIGRNGHANSCYALSDVTHVLDVTCASVGITSPVDPPVSIPAQSGQPPKITGEFEFQGLNATCVRIHCPAMSREQFQISWTLGTESLTTGIRRGGLEVDKDGELTACLAANRLKELELVCRASNRFGFVAQKETISLLGKFSICH